jgi:hypothetical protein
MAQHEKDSEPDDSSTYDLEDSQHSERWPDAGPPSATLAWLSPPRPWPEAGTLATPSEGRKAPAKWWLWGRRS